MTTENKTLSDDEIRRMSQQICKFNRDPKFLREETQISTEKRERDLEKQLAKMTPEEIYSHRRKMILSFVALFTIMSVLIFLLIILFPCLVSLNLPWCYPLINFFFTFFYLLPPLE